MELWNDFNKLNILLDDEDIDKEYVEYGLYKECYIAAVTSIFRSTIDYDKNADNDRFLENRQSNIYAFIGRRGSGKTTAMNEFCRILEELNDYNIRQWWMERVPRKVREGLTGKKFHFQVLKPIDASLLEVKEDLFELILVKLYEIYRDYLKANTRDFQEDALCSKNINLQFEKVLRMYRAIKSGEKEDNSIASMLQFMGSSMDIRDALAQLVDLLIDIILPKNNSAHSFIVVAVDDVDLNLKYGYEMLEQLQKYFCYYKILIVVAVDYEQMVSVCTQHFTQEMQGDKVEHCSELANYYMTKVFPFSQRVFMPDMKKITKQAQIEVKDSKPVLVKNYIMGKIAKAMYIYYDIVGEKCHFSEPQTVRELVFYNKFLEDLVRIDYDEIKKIKNDEDRMSEEKKKLFMQHYDRNHQRFNWDIIGRQCQMTLDSNQQKEFKLLLEHALKRRAVYAVKLALGKLHEKKPIVYSNQMIDQIQSQYTYGQLLELIYKWGREIPEDKPLVSCIIASFTSEMVREYINFKYVTDSVHKEESRQRLVGFLGNSFGNEWTGECLKVSGKINDKDFFDINLGFIRDAEPKSVKIQFNNIKTSGQGINKNNIKKPESFKGYIKQWLEGQEIVPIIECLDMFVISKEEYKYSGLKVAFEVDFDTDSDADKENTPKNSKASSQKKLFAKCVNENFSLDIMAFVAKSLNYNEQRKEVHDMLAEKLADVIHEQMKEIDDNCINRQKVYEIILDIIPALGMLEEAEDEAALPYYDLDLMYNIFKRVYRKNAQSIKNFENIYEHIKNIYYDIDEELQRERKKYNEIGVPFPYTDIFKLNPYIKMFQNISETTQNQVFKALWSIATLDNKPKDTSDN